MALQNNKYLDVLKQLIRREITEQYWIQKNSLARGVRKADLYYRGFQYLALQEMPDGRGLDYVPVTGPDVLARTMGRSSEDDLPEVLDYCLNIYKGDLDKFVSVALKQPIKHKAAPVISSQIDQVGNRLRVADMVKEYLYVVWNWDVTRRLIFSTMAKYGPAFLYTSVVTDENKFGKSKLVTHESKEGMAPPQWPCSCGASNEGKAPSEDPYSDMCEGCGEMLDPGMYVEETATLEFKEVEQEFANTGCELHVANTLTVMISPKTKVEDGIGASPWLWYEYDVDEGQVKRFMDEANEKLKPASSVSTLDLIGLIQTKVESVTAWTAAVGFQKQRRLARFWLGPDMFANLSDSGEQLEVKNALREQYPRGVKITMVGDQIVALEHEHHKDVWRVAVPGNGEYIMAAQALFEPYFEAQDMINDTVNMTETIIATSAPLTGVDASKIDVRSLNQNVGRGARQIIPIKGDPNRAMADFPVSQPTGVSINWMTQILASAREIVGINPSMWGMGIYPTAREAVIANESSLQIFAPVFNIVATESGEAMRNAALQLAMFTNGNLPLRDGLTRPVEVPEIEILLEGGWIFTYDPSIAISSWARRDRIMELLNSPQTAQMMGLNHPASIRRIHEAVGLEGVYTPGMDDMDWMEEELTKLTTGGQPEVPPIELINPQQAGDYVKAWLVGPKGRQLKQRDPEAYGRGIEYLKVVNPPPAQPLPGMDPGMGGPPPADGGLPPEGPAPVGGPEGGQIQPNQGLDGMGAG